MKLGRSIALDLTVRESSYFWQAAGTSRFAWNWALSRWNEDYAAAKAEPDLDKRKTMWPSVAGLKEEWAKVRREEFPWSLDVTKCAGTQAIIDLGATFARAQKERREARLQGRKPRKMFGFPKFKAKSKTKPGFALWNDQFAIENHFPAFGRAHATVRIPNLGMVRLREPVPGVGGILGARCSYRRGRWFIAFQFDMGWNDGELSNKAAEIAQGKARKAAVAAGVDKHEAKRTIVFEAARPIRLLPLHPNAGTVGGGDLGLIDALVGHVEKVGSGAEPGLFRKPNPRRLTRTAKQSKMRKRRQRKLSRSIHKARTAAAQAEKLARGDNSAVTWKELRSFKLRLSNRQRRQSERLSVDTWANADRRNDFLHKLSNQVSRSAEIMILEDLHVTGMLANRCLAKSLSDSALGRLATFIEYKAEREGGLVLWAPRFFPSSKRCSSCGHKHTELRLDEREWSCTACSTVHDRDANAAANLCWLGQIAAGTDLVPEQAKPWGEWIEAARAQVATWRLAKAMDRTFLSSDGIEDVPILGTACPEFTRGERADRAGRNPGRGVRDEPRTTTARTNPCRDGQTHICSPCG